LHHDLNLRIPPPSLRSTGPTQSRITDFFAAGKSVPVSVKPHNTSIDTTVCSTPPNTSRHHNYKKYLLLYSPCVAQPKITHYTKLPHETELHDAWGHSLPSIDTSSTFRILLQNPNGLNLDTNNYSLLHDIQTCADFGAAVISLPETNVHWALPSTRTSFRGMLKRMWPHVTISTSESAEPFLSTYKPGGTATVVCDKWTSRVMETGEDTYGLGRWSYVILRGKGTTKVAVITAYNVSQKSHIIHGEKTAYKQQLRLLTNLYHHHKIQAAPHPHRQFILDLQSWIETLIADNHDIILAMDANDPYNPDVTVSPHPLNYTAGTPTMDKHHDGHLSTLVSTCHLRDPLALQHSDRPFPASYFCGKQRIDYILVSPRLVGAVTHSGSLPLYSLFQGDHRPYYIDLDATVAFADNAYEICRPQGHGLQLCDPRIITKYIDSLRDHIA
jgi:hypothetical protein